MASMSASVPVRVIYCTDVEGNYDYWSRYIELSHGLSRAIEGGRLLLDDGYHFVFGGDVCDRGAGDLRLLDDLNNLYDDYAGRVHFILGNRDVNKMRVPVELHERHLARPGSVYWCPTDSEDGGNRIERMKWILAKTMGSPGGFAYRKEELGLLGKHNSDDDVVQSYIDQATGKDSPIIKYLSRGVVAVNFGEVLFCHGGFNDGNIGWLPPTKPGEEGDAVEGKSADVATTPGPIGGDLCDDFKDWIAELNRRCRAEVNDYINRTDAYLAGLTDEFQPHWGAIGSYDHDQPGSRLGFLGMANIPGVDKKTNPSVVYSSYMNQGMPVDVSAATAAKLAESGIRRVIVGHQPHGDAPTIIQAHGLQIFMGDTSYSANTLWNYDDEGMWAKRTSEQLAEPCLGLTGLPVAADNTRGVCVSEISVCIPSGDLNWGSTSEVACRGILSDGSTYTFVQPPAAANKYVGMMTASKTWMVKGCNVTVKAGPFAGKEDVYLLSRGEGFNFKNKYVLGADMDKFMLE